MRKILFTILAILFSVGIANATGIPTGVAYDRAVVWTEDVYNGSGTDIATGMVVEWDFDTCDVTDAYYDDMGPWVKTVNAADDIWTAGVTLPYGSGVPNGKMGTIIIKGPAVVYDGTSGSVCTAGQLVGSETTGAVGDFSGGSADNASLGVCIKAIATQQGYTGDALIYVDPMRQSDD